MPLDVSRVSDEERLKQLGYQQTLARSMSGRANFGVSFTIISILSGCMTLYGYGMNTGGPAVIMWGWLFVGLMTLFVGLSMAEVCSSYSDQRRPLLLERTVWPQRERPPPGHGSPAGSTPWVR